MEIQKQSLDRVIGTLFKEGYKCDMGHKNHKKCFVVDTEVAFTDTWLLQQETIIFTLYKKLTEPGAPSECLVVGGLGQVLFWNTGLPG